MVKTVHGEVCISVETLTKPFKMGEGGGGGAAGHWILYCLVLQDLGIQGDRSVAEASQQMQWDQKTSTFPSIISLDGVKGYHLKPMNHIVVA